MTQAYSESRPQVLQVLVSHTASQGGLIRHLAIAYEAQNRHIKIEIDTAGALTVLDRARLGHTGLVITHHPPSEKLFMDEGFGASRTLLMYNQFALFGPPGDPLGLNAERELLVVLRRLAENEVAFMVPGKQSGTQKKLEDLWSMAGVEPDWPGYEISGSSSASTLHNASIFDAYAFADIATYLANMDKLKGKIIPIYRDHTALRNYYSAIVINGDRFQDFTQQALAQSFVDFLVSDAGQFLIKSFGETNYNTTIFTPAAHLDLGIKAQRMKGELETKRRNLRILSGLAIILAMLSLAVSWLFLRTRRLEKTTRLSEERFALAVEGSSDGIWDWDINSDEAYFSPRINEILGRSVTSTSIINPVETLQHIIHPRDKRKLSNTLHRYLQDNDNSIFCAEYRLQQKTSDGENIWVMMRGKVLRTASGQPTRMSGSLTDITENKKQEAAIEYQALHDSLTDLPNRALLHDRLEQAVKTALRTNTSFALLMMDLNRFKEVNDTLGHQIGDEVLIHVAQRLKRILRSSDTVARLGGDEFAVLINDAGATYANHVAQKILLSMKKVFELRGHNLYVGGSVGISVFPQHGMDAQTMLKHADIAMYVAKRNNSGVSIYDTNQDQHSVRRLTLEKDLHDAIENNTLKLHYQPKIDLRTKMVVSVEALLRWDHPEMGTIPPIELIEIAEQTGLIKSLTLWIVSTALAQLNEWQDRGLELDVAINLSMWNLQDPGLAHEIEHLLIINKIAASRLELEITESAMIADINKTMEVLNLLSDTGIQLAIDDYGTGFSSLAYLKKLPVNILKIDKSFVLGMTRDKHDNSIVHSTIELAHNLGLKVVAEGVEDKATINQLADMGCEIAQGYYFSRPLSQDALVQWMQNSPWGFSFPSKLHKQLTTTPPPTTVH